MAKKRIVILGAGLSGLSIAWHLQNKGMDCLILEKESEVGGLCRSKKIKGFTFDYDGHLLHFKHRYTFKLIQSLLGNNLVQRKRQAFVYSGGQYIRYPFQANLAGLNPDIIEDCLLGFINTFENKKSVNNNGHNFHCWIKQVFGEGIARHFMEPYNNKFWTVSTKKLTSDWVDGFIPVPTLQQVIEGVVGENNNQFGYNIRFWYPKNGGISSVPAAFARSIKNIRVNCELTGIDLVKKQIKINSSGREDFDFLVSTIPLPELSGLIKNFPSTVNNSLSKLRWNSIFNLNLGLEGRNCSAHHWVYFPQKEICFFRVGFPHNFSSSVTPAGKSSLYAEVSYSRLRPINKGKILTRIVRDLRNSGILHKEEKICVQDTNDIEYGYPIYDAHYRQSRETVIKYLLANDFIPCGRYGSWRYMSMEDVILEAKQVSENLVSKYA